MERGEEPGRLRSQHDSGRGQTAASIGPGESQRAGGQAAEDAAQGKAQAVARARAAANMFKYRGIELSGLVLSLVLHTLTGASLAFFHFRHRPENLNLSIETLFDSERSAEEFTRELNTDIEVSETLNIVPGGGGGMASVSSALGGGGGGGAGGTGSGGTEQDKMDAYDQVRYTTIHDGGGEIGLPGIDTMR